MRPSKGFTILEILVVLCVLAVVASIVAPRMSRGASSSPQLPEQLLIGHLRALRTAIDSYASDHVGQFPAGDAETSTRQLTGFTDIAGQTSPNKSTRHRFGPYIREIPPLPIGPNTGKNTLRIADEKSDIAAGWLYNPISGQITPDVAASSADHAGRLFLDY